MATAEYDWQRLNEFGVLAIVAQLEAPNARQVDLSLITRDFALQLRLDGLDPRQPMVVRWAATRDAYVFEQ